MMPTDAAVLAGIRRILPRASARDRREFVRDMTLLLAEVEDDHADSQKNPGKIPEIHPCTEGAQ